MYMCVCVYTHTYGFVKHVQNFEIQENGQNCNAYSIQAKLMQIIWTTLSHDTSIHFTNKWEYLRGKSSEL